MNKLVSIVKKLAENWKRISLFVKVIFVGVFLLVLLAILNYIIFYTYINSGGINAKGWLLIYLGLCGISFCFYFYAAICLILSFFRMPKITNFIFSLVGIIFIHFIQNACTGVEMSRFFGQADTDIVRYYAYNNVTIDHIKEFSNNVMIMRTRNDIFTEHYIKVFLCKFDTDEKFTSITRPPIPDIDFNKNLLGLKPNQVPSNIVMLFQSGNKDSAFAGPNDISADWHYGKGSVVLFGDGRIEFVKKEKFKDLRW